MTEVWITIAGLTAATVALKAAGPVLVGGRELPDAAFAVIALLAPALLAALVLIETFTHDQELTVDARAAGLGCAAVAVLLRAPLLVTVLVAAVGTAAVRAIA
ncbi:MAG TPA: AzlD domain-containing protein [Thermoleophilaceae bacterium]|nr:AzlD domain-containing protein [Thermoleophilaceae bacterium]